MSSKTVRVGVVGGRGVVGKELMRLLQAHPSVSIVFGEGDRVDPAQAALKDVDVLFLSAPNGVAKSYVATAKAETVIVDLSSDYRFDSAWVYGLPERNRDRVRGQKRISNPGCYATGVQLGIDPFLSVLGGMPTAFGVSGYSGAGTTPSPKNDPVRLADNLLPYSLVDHMHELEVTEHLGIPVAFMPHVASFFVGITLTISLPLARSMSLGELKGLASKRYANEPLIKVVDDIPEVKDARGTHEVTLGGITVAKTGARAAVVVTLDNLLKGAATQAVQNMNLACGFEELVGIRGT